MEPQKLTKAALSKFIVWSTSRYNDWLGFGTKKENVDLVYRSIQCGYHAGHTGRKPNQENKKFIIECSAGNGETYNGKSFRNWRVKGRPGDYKYEIDCVEKKVTGIPSGNVIKFK